MASSQLVTRNRSRRAIGSVWLPNRDVPVRATARASATEVQPAVDTRPQAVIARLRWQQRYATRLALTDSALVVSAVILAHQVRFGAVPQTSGRESLYLAASSGLIAVCWLIALAALRTRSVRVIGAGVEEYRRVVVASLSTFGALAIAELLVKLEISRGYLAVALPVGTIGLLAGRWCNRRFVAAQRVAGRYRTAVLAVGDSSAATYLAVELMSDPSSGYHVVGIYLPGAQAGRDEYLTVADQPIPIIGDEVGALRAICDYGADTVALAGTGHLSVQQLRTLIWDLEPMGVDLMVSPGVVDVAPSRLVLRPISGIPLVQVEKPQYRGTERFQKRAFDFGFAACALMATAPILLISALLIKLTTKGPVFYRAERIGLDGKPFMMLKLRSMVADADQQFESLLARNESDGVLFKIRDDPRITPVGRLLRRFSIDELPQFINVLRQEMSVVGPRPPLRREVEAYDRDVSRRLLVKPGITGLWQISGRSDLSWDKSVRLDLAYVDNWSMVGDLAIVAKTLRAVLERRGAY